MSYILDALKKSDQQRQHGKVPTLLATQSTPESSRPRASALNVWLAVVLIGAGILIGWLRPWQTEIPAETVESASVHSVAPPVSAENTATHRTDLPAAVIKHPAVPSSQNDLPAVQAGLGMPPTRPKPVESALHRQPDTASEAPATAASASPQHFSEGKNVLTLDELPAAVRQALPGILIAFHQFSSIPAERRVMINNLVLRQGESIAPGLRLEQITADGVVISFQGYQFQRGVR